MRWAPVRVLHLFANWKWTGPAEPAVGLAASLAARGVDVHFACGREVGTLPNEVANEARARGLTPVLDFHLGKHRHPIYDGMDRRALRAYLKKLKPAVIHCHLPNDERIAAGAAEGLGIAIVRSLYDGDPPPVDKDHRQQLAGADGVITISERMRDAVVARFGLTPARCVAIDPAIDLKRFNPKSKAMPDLRAEYGLAPEDFVVGIVARMQKHRRFEIFFEALTKAAAEIPNLKVLLVGRGTWMDEVAVKPAARRELVGKAIFTGYRRGAEYVATLACMSVKVYLTPGSDGSCRAAREAMAMGVPIVAARRGHLVDLVEDGVTGVLVDDDPEQLAAALVRLATDEPGRRAMSDASYKKAHKRFGLAQQAKAVEAFYAAVSGGRPPA
jgi:glycosyltransferase involved in cell wall biosynthesis